MPVTLFRIEKQNDSPYKKAKYERDKFGSILGVCQNGYQWSSMTVDKELLLVIKSVIDQALQEDEGLQ